MTVGPGAVIKARHPLGRKRFRICAATSESSSLKPSKVSTAICISALSDRPLAATLKKRRLWPSWRNVGHRSDCLPINFGNNYLSNLGKR
jgi:hypothetical protein